MPLPKWCIVQRKMPDAIWNDTYWEYKAPSTKNAIDSRLQKARKQIEEALARDNKEYSKCGVVLDITDRKIPLEECIKCIEDRASDRCLNNTEVIIKDKDKVIKILRVKKIHSWSKAGPQMDLYKISYLYYIQNQENINT